MDAATTTSFDRQGCCESSFATIAGERGDEQATGLDLRSILSW